MIEDNLAEKKIKKNNEKEWKKSNSVCYIYIYPWKIKKTNKKRRKRKRGRYNNIIAKSWMTAIQRGNKWKYSK